MCNTNSCQSTTPAEPVSRRRSAGFTLIELLVVIAIIGILIAMLLPAVQAAREAARRAKCTSQLKQMSMALHLYHDAQSVFPQGNYSPKHWTFQAAILPYMEQGALFDMIDYNARSCFAVTRDDGPEAVASRELPMYVCPSEARVGEKFVLVDQTTGGTAIYAMTSYFGMIGTQHAEGPLKYGLYKTWDRDGILFRSSHIKMRDIRDGTSNTIMLGERGYASDLLLGWWACGAGDRNSGHADNLLSAELGLSPGGKGNLHRYHFWSHHPGGAHMTMADTSTRFFSYGTDLNLLLDMATREGREPPRP
jgi:prepilin-type N-terminal cleavage/methylation domain-containing protein